MNEPLIYIIIVNYNNCKDTIQCVESLERIIYENYKIIIIDNASLDNSKKILMDKFPEIKIIYSITNLGFAGGNNIGISFALNNEADYVLLINNDTIVEPVFLGNMVNSFSNGENVDLVGCKIMYYPEKNKIWFGGGKIDWFRFSGIHLGIGEIDNGQYDYEREIDFVTGCCMLIKSEVLKKIGFLSNDYFMYFEDVDFCVKVKEAGFKIWYNPSSVIYHKVSISSGGEESPFLLKWTSRNRIIFMNKFRYKVNFFKFIASKVYFIVTRKIYIAKYTFTGQNIKASAIKEGIKMSKIRL